MPIELIPCNEDPICFGFRWEITDEDYLARLVARLLFGHYRHVQKIIAGEQIAPTPAITAAMMGTIVTRLTTTTPDAVRYQRDGWVFQMMSWIAAKKNDPSSLSAIPHSQRAQKGFDNIIVKIADDGNVESVLICEDKATENPRQTVREEVWPEIRIFESGSRDGELVNEVSAILERAQGHVDVDACMATIFWEQARHYRISITTKRMDSEARRRKLFSGYDGTVSGDQVRRRAETFLVQQLRQWMDDFCSKILIEIRALNV